ncbi:MAG: ROK family protein [Deltaproteobacteria bacterium]|nr:ROK family protein [Deltaproteobacteria bacterium]MBW1951537.1 ROK family protein [Deltaproteobacteria bacterium]MBW1987350.1 ROK family protein [Deltaproteobacteria bacterium]MBW2135204.1 ROK family protein [Deltaproteobacteria bacterium]
MQVDKEPVVIGVDLGGTNLRLALVTGQGEIRDRQAFPTPKGRGAQVLLEKLAEAITTMARKTQNQSIQIQAVGMGVPGRVLPEEGRVIFSPNLPELNGYQLGAAARDLLPWPLVMDNDANIFTLGEQWLGAGQGRANILGITLGTGVGGGLVLNGKIWPGEAGSTAEIGHITIDPQGEVCNCGNRGCLETLASAPWTVAWVKARLAAGESSCLRASWEQDPESLGGRQLQQAAEAGDALAQAAFNRVGRALGQAVTDVVHLMGLSLVVIGGKFSLAWDQFIGSLEDELDHRLTLFPRRQLQVVPATLGDNAGLLGAARLAWDKVP